MRTSFLKELKTPFFIFLSLMLTSGCSLGGKPAYLIKQYIFEYPPPVVEGVVQEKELIKVERFSAAQDFNTLSMVYRDGPFQRGVDPYHRWRVNPGDMVTDYLMRDLRKARLFQAVFSYNDGKDTRYLLEGRVDEFLELGEKDGRKAALSLNVTFLDLTKKETIEKVVFQRDYRYIEPIETPTPEGLAQGMSKAMEKFSKQLIKDLYNAIKDIKR
jgi:ABC-type uncharacterized transport system auxiliary subunit